MAGRAVASAGSDVPFLSGPRLLVWGLFVLAIANGVFLYVFPWLARDWYAWSIQPPVNAAAMGAGYLGGTLATGLGIFAVRRWRSIRVLMGPFAVLGLSLLAATLLHAERFKWDYFLTWVWTAVYALLPVGSLVIWLWQERLGGHIPPLDGRLGAIRAVSLWAGVGLLLASLWLFASPQSFMGQWPWAMTPLLGRVFAGWYIFAGLLMIFVALMARKPNEVPVTYGTLALWNALLLLLPVLYAGSMRTDLAGFWVFVALHLALLGFTAWAALSTWRWMNEAGESL